MWTRELSCFRCGTVAATMRCEYSEGRQGWMLYRTGFLDRKAMLCSQYAAEEMVDTEDIDLGRWLPGAWLGFRCQDCGADYCQSCWSVEAPLFEDDDYIQTAALCPGGHHTLVDW